MFAVFVAWEVSKAAKLSVSSDEQPLNMPLRLVALAVFKPVKSTDVRFLQP